MSWALISHWIGRLSAALLLAMMLAGCGSFSGDIDFGPRIGFRPDAPTFQVPGAVQRPDKPDKKVDSCTALKEYFRYAENLKESYRVRATQNRTWIYVAAVTGLGVAAASGALAAATAVAAGTLALLAISGGFTSATFATIDNSELANVYTVAANNIGKAMANVEARVTRCPGEVECAAQLAYLTTTITDARNTLETARTSSAAGALARATAQKTLLDQEITKASADLKARTAADAAKKAKADEVAATAAHDDARAKADAIAANAPGKLAAESEAKDKKDAKDKAVAEATAAEKAAADAKIGLDFDSAAKAEALIAVKCLPTRPAQP
jgi:hypothetical protein